MSHCVRQAALRWGLLCTTAVSPSAAVLLIRLWNGPTVPCVGMPSAARLSYILHSTPPVYLRLGQQRRGHSGNQNRLCYLVVVTTTAFPAGTRQRLQLGDSLDGVRPFLRRQCVRRKGRTTAVRSGSHGDVCHLVERAAPVSSETCECREGNNATNPRVVRHKRMSSTSRLSYILAHWRVAGTRYRQQHSRGTGGVRLCEFQYKAVSESVCLSSFRQHVASTDYTTGVMAYLLRGFCFRL